ncbi:Pterin-4-alpha-carbinolamine dehydratase [Serinicoccus hydrothermalis]|uniref:Putative pterin-4-alpha-carbinolamine dehydratase n=1 Tax=Serinicoccus hydrothermalis TaxID=1758689 RepID=A0A1B1NA46_9MICO|nr:VOC family protein [Serinicoccus hydrothermalis]ANS78296.1 Pterin-4-alpha-carbinolamine dehydratase [Serinicoccus hydrothermalis]
MSSQTLTDHALSTDPELADWRVLRGRLHARFATGDFAAGARLVARIAELADEVDHHPDVDLRYPHVTVSTVSHDVGALTTRDRALAVAVSAAAAELGLEARPHEVSELEVALDVMDAPSVEPFWAAVLGYAETEEDHLEDPAGRLAPMWFQQMDEARTQRGRFHLDLDVPHDLAQERVVAALAAGGHLVTDEFAPSWWVLADAEGNEVCVCTWQGREGSGETPA